MTESNNNAMRDVTPIGGLLTSNASIRKSGGAFVVRVSGGEITLLDAGELVALGDALMKYGEAQR